MSRGGRIVVCLTVAVIAVVGPGAGVSLADHAYGDARHWSDGSQPRAYVTIVDHTPSEWPVLAATNEWATEPNIDVYYDFGSCGGTGHCVDVELYTFADPCYSATGPFVGGVTYQPTANGHYTNAVYVRLNSKCGNTQWTNRDRRALACHELGHVMGLGHEPSSDRDVTCMASPSPQRFSIADLYEHPRSHDFYALHNTVYDHNDS